MLSGFEFRDTGGYALAWQICNVTVETQPPEPGNNFHLFASQTFYRVCQRGLYCFVADSCPAY